MGEKGNLEPATVTDATGGRSVASTVVGVAADKGATFTDAVIAESAGAGVGAVAGRLTGKDDEDGDDGDDAARDGS